MFSISFEGPSKRPMRRKWKFSLDRKTSGSLPRDAGLTLFPLFGFGGGIALRRVVTSRACLELIAHLRNQGSNPSNRLLYIGVKSASGRLLNSSASNCRAGHAGPEQGGVNALLGMHRYSQENGVNQKIKTMFNMGGHAKLGEDAFPTPHLFSQTYFKLF
jgi:hypothetical protein